MCNRFLFLLAFFLAPKLYAQQPAIQAPELLVFHPDTKKPVPLKITELDCEVEITGNRMTTTFYFTFFNDFNRDLEGKLEFPLGEGENVTRFALEVNGALREGVVVDKNKGQKVFEEIEHKNVDPGLLEKTSGNHYRARVYPVPHNGSKRLAIGYEKILSSRLNEDLLVHVPLVMGQKIGKFRIRVTVFNQEQTPRQGNDAGVNLDFEKWENAFVAQKDLSDFEADKVLTFKVPRKEVSEFLFIEKQQDEVNRYFFSATVYPQYKPVPKPDPKTIAVYWDASISGKSRGTEKEFQLLEAYLEKMKNVQVKIYAFNIEVSQRDVIQVRNGKADAVIETLRNIPFDGATRMDLLDLSPKTCDEVLLFSDGINTLGNEKIKTGTVPVYTIVSGPSANYDQLKYISTLTGGELINLSEKDPGKALEQLGHLPYRFINCRGPVQEVYSDLNLASDHAFTVSGICTAVNTEMELQFGYGDSVLATQKIKLSDKNLIKGNRTEHTWALQKLNRLQLMPEKNREEIIAHSTRYAIASSFTSLIVLENVSDYVFHKIVPPAELQQEYYATLEKGRAEADQVKKDRIEQVVKLYDQKLQWWNTDYTDSIIKVEQAIRKKKLEEKLTLQLTILDSMHDILQTRLDSVNYAREDVQWRLDSLHSPDHIKARLIRHSEESYKMKQSVATYSVHSENAAMAAGGTYDELVRMDRAVTADLGFDFGNPPSREEKNRDQIKISEWNPDTPYLDELKAASDADLYKTYLRLRENYLGNVSFYLDAADVFMNRNRKKEAVLILSNLAELKDECYTFMRILGHRYLQIGQLDYSVDMFERVLKLRREEPQSYRDLGNALARNQHYQAAIDTLYQVALMDWSNRFPEFENIALTEMNGIISTCGEKLNTAYMDPRLLKSTPAEVRIILNWDTDYCDIDLHVTGPNEEECFFSHPLTKIGGRMSRDFTRGLGPEEFMARKAMRGNYKIEINYYGQSATEILGPTTVMIQVYTHYGQPNQEVKEITRRLEREKERITIGEIEIK